MREAALLLAVCGRIPSQGGPEFGMQIIANMLAQAARAVFPPYKWGPY